MHLRFLCLGYLLLSLWGIGALPLQAQQPDTLAADSLRVPSLAVQAWSDGARVVLRWAPTSYLAWDHGNAVGYHVERVRINPQQPPSEPLAYERLTSQPLRPWSLELWRQRIPNPEARPQAAIAAQMLYGAPAPIQARNPFEAAQLRAAEQENRFSFALFAADLDSLAAEGLGLRYEDAAVEPGATYIYRVFAAAPHSSLRLDTAYVVVTVAPTPPATLDVSVEVEPGDGQLRLCWDPRLAAYAFTAYVVERSEDGQQYQLMTETPLVQIETNATLAENRMLCFTDSTTVNYRRYYYRIYGIDAFARRSRPVEVTGMSRDLTPPPPPVLETAEHVRESTVRLRWRLDNPSPDLAGFFIGISNSPDGPFEIGEELPPSTREATDSRAISGINNYYIVLAVDTAGNLSSSMPQYVHLIDSIPPAPPTGLVAHVDTTGILTLRWQSNQESDLLGYRVYRANQLDHTFTLATGFPLTDTVFVDTLNLNTLTEAIYYRVVALDRNYNPSDPSEPVRVILPDRVPPVSPLFTRVTPTDSSIILHWIPSSSSDVVRVHLYRKRPREIFWTEIAVLDPAVQQYEDTSVKPERRYYYTLRAEDDAGNLSAPSPPVQARPYVSARRASVTNLRARYDARNRRVVLTWTYQDSTPHWFVIYRGFNEQPLRRYRSAGRALRFEDLDLIGPGTYRYAVQVYFENGAVSPISKEVTVVVSEEE
ncbi:fibronectin type III domain-containing protein [Rhodothermus profundi]|uniref:Fibronectin type 3 domain-containing protein n=1 Tax=Rhodothermus profundi TaxID=633813 RepID=A0A1M6XB37_9BACT|nr:hypothetical protein [Rhodothermus profundi]SHL03138.1 fibronectin type 3 domain-containing protein [Rhodothermus profundi]